MPTFGSDRLLQVGERSLSVTLGFHKAGDNCWEGSGCWGVGDPGAEKGSDLAS